MMTSAATIFTVRDLAASVAFYRDRLGFTVTFEYGEPAYYACLCRDEVGLHLRSGHGSPSWRPGNGALAVFVTDVDALYDELLARGARPPKPPQDYAYGMRDFTIEDPDGNEITLGMATGEPAT
ncbi:MAG: bleomycin resistance protein [Rhodospirillales bacterium]